MSVGQFKSDAAHLPCGVPQSSVPGSVLFAPYLLALVELLIILMTSSYTVCLLHHDWLPGICKNCSSDNLLQLNGVIMETWNAINSAMLVWFFF